jgi:adenylylsulfate kinase-like enzyme
MNEIQINVIGTCGLGRSTVAYAIYECLKNYGFSVGFNDGNDYTKDGMPEQDMQRWIPKQSLRLTSLLQKGLTVNVRTIQSARKAVCEEENGNQLLSS